MSQQEQNEREKKMFGETIEQMEKAKPGFYDNGLYAAAILSDVQEVLARLDQAIGEPANGASQLFKNELELSRQWINKAKYFIDQARQEVRR